MIPETAILEHKGFSHLFVFLCSLYSFQEASIDWADLLTILHRNFYYKPADIFYMVHKFPSKMAAIL